MILTIIINFFAQYQNATIKNVSDTCSSCNQKDMRDMKQAVETDSDRYHLILWSSSSVDKIIAFSVNGDNETISDGTG